MIIVNKAIFLSDVGVRILKTSKLSNARKVTIETNKKRKHLDTQKVRVDTGGRLRLFDVKNYGVFCTMCSRLLGESLTK